MLARKTKLKLNGLEVGTTPMLVPAFSSKADIDMCKTIETMSEPINGPILISAYDVNYAKKFPPISFPDLIFLDSGGYECLRDEDVSETGFYQPAVRPWDRDIHLKVVREWPKNIPTVLISYDHPSERVPTKKQIEDAKDLFHQTDNILKEILIKPEPDRKRIRLDDIIKNIDALSKFDILGFTEKELGYSIFDRMVMIAKIRVEMDKREIRIPIHIFGSLDTITTPLYYFSGADIFDGLSWLRFVFHNGETLYINSSGPRLHGIQTNMDVLSMTAAASNYGYMLRLKMDLKRFQSTGTFDHFKNNSDFFSDAYDNLKVEIEGVL